MRKNRLLSSILLILLIAGAVRATSYRYDYVLWNEVMPQTETFISSPAAITNDGKIYFDYINFETSECGIGYYFNGSISIVTSGLLPDNCRILLPFTPDRAAVTEAGRVGGVTFISFDDYTYQSTIFRQNRIELIPRLPGELESNIIDFANGGAALVRSLGTSFNGYALYRRGEIAALNLPIESALSLRMNKHGLISGRGRVGTLDRAFRYDTNISELVTLEPLPTEQKSWGLGINKHGQVVGYSFNTGGYERIGFWNLNNQFEEYYVQGPPFDNVLSNQLLINDRGWIVATQASTRTSYLYPRPELRLNLGDLVNNRPANLNIDLILDLNNRGDMLGYDQEDGHFILKRIRRPEDPD